MFDAVSRLKAELANLCYSGKAAQLRGIIVSPAVARALQDDSENFKGTIRAAGKEGNRWIRYAFYVLENPNFPHRAQDFFFVPHPKERYQQEFLGREDEILRERLKILSTVVLKLYSLMVKQPNPDNV